MRTKISNLTFIFIISLVSILPIIASPVYASRDPSGVLLPSNEITLKVVKHPGSKCYYDLLLSDVPSGYHVSNGIYRGWCVDEYHRISSYGEYRARMYSSYDPNNPYYDPDWDKVNYILNHKKGTWWDVQQAIWYFVDGGRYPSNPEGQSMVEEAKIKGEGFVPGPGQVLAVTLWIDDNTQVPIIEVNVPFDNVVPQYPFGPIMGTFIFIAALCTFKYRNKIPKLLTK